MLLRLSDRKYPCTMEDVGADNPNIAIPSSLPDEELRGYGYARVESTPAPYVDIDLQLIREDTPELVGTSYKQRWVVEMLPAKEIEDIKNSKAGQDRVIAINALQTLIDSIAQERGYDSALSCLSYIGDSNPKWSQEAYALRQWRSSVWSYGHGVEDAVAAGGPRPSLSEFIEGAPKMVWPEVV